jgi:hypothetical protein
MKAKERWPKSDSETESDDEYPDILHRPKSKRPKRGQNFIRNNPRKRDRDTDDKDEIIKNLSVRIKEREAACAELEEQIARLSNQQIQNVPGSPNQIKLIPKGGGKPVTYMRITYTTKPFSELTQETKRKKIIELNAFKTAFVGSSDVNEVIALNKMDVQMNADKY